MTPERNHTRRIQTLHPNTEYSQGSTEALCVPPVVDLRTFPDPSGVMVCAPMGQTVQQDTTSNKFFNKRTGGVSKWHLVLEQAGVGTSTAGEPSETSLSLNDIKGLSVGVGQRDLAFNEPKVDRDLSTMIQDAKQRHPKTTYRLK